MSRPTEEAARLYDMASGLASLAQQAAYGTTNQTGGLLSEAVHNLAKGLRQSNAGLRATYMLLEEVKAMLSRPGPGR